MTGRYRKWGRSVRREGAHLISVDEAGEAIDENGSFRARALDEVADLPLPDREAVDATARQIESLIVAPLFLERLIVSEGIAEHEFEGIRWRDTARRIHLSLARPPLRALIDLAEFRLDGIRQIAAAMIRAGEEREAPRHLRLAEAVGAALLPSLSIDKTQAAAAFDGNGQPVQERPVEPGTPPNWFRPSYRLRPRRAWLHLRAVAAGEVDPRAAEAVALLAPVDGRKVRVLCVDGSVAYPATIDVSRVLGARPASTWYPYGAGAFGVEIML